MGVLSATADFQSINNQEMTVSLIPLFIMSNDVRYDAKTKNSCPVELTFRVYIYIKKETLSFILYNNSRTRFVSVAAETEYIRVTLTNNV